ncbi:MAG: hypothetical protein ACTSW4_03085 [Candidatus Ranarchaeia archaeon]
MPNSLESLYNSPTEGLWYPEDGIIFLSLMLMEYFASAAGWVIGALLILRRINVFQSDPVHGRTEEPHRAEFLQPDF